MVSGTETLDEATKLMVRAVQGEEEGGWKISFRDDSDDTHLCVSDEWSMVGMSTRYEPESCEYTVQQVISANDLPTGQCFKSMSILSPPTENENMRYTAQLVKDKRYPLFF